MLESSRLSFATSNDHKFSEARLVLSEFGFGLARLKTKGGEIQSDDVTAVASAAARALSTKYKSPFFVEDTGLFVKSLGGFPGSYAAFVLRTIGLRGVLDLLSNASNRSAEFVSAVAYVEAPRGPKVFVGRLQGSISPRIRGRRGFGFDPLFIPGGSTRTLAEFSMNEKCDVSHRAKALRAMGEWLVSR